MRKIIPAITIAALVLGIAGCQAQEKTAPPETTLESDSTTETGEETKTENQSSDFDGIYSGEGQGHGGKILIDLTIQDGKISSIDVKENSETPGIADAMDVLTKQMIAGNTLDIDTISGATYTSQGFIDAVEDAFAKSGASKSDLIALESKLATEERESEYSADIIVIGGGGAGLNAAIEASSNGSSVIILEKMPSVGGNTLLSGAEMAAPDNWLQQEEGIEDSTDLMYEDTLKGGDNENDPELVRILADNALAGAEWLRDDIDVTFEDYMLFFGGHSVKRSLVPLNASGVELISKLKTKAEEENIPIHLNTKAVALRQDDSGRVIGVNAEYADGEITYHAAKAVIVATGGFGANLEMRKEHNPDMDEKILSTNSVGSTGDGIQMAEEIGAQIVDMSYIQTYPTCDTETGTLLYVGDVRLEGRAILVNKEGNRFVEELERRDVISKAVTEQTGNVSYLFWDQASMDASGVNVKHKDEYNTLIDRGMMVKAETLDEAAEFFDIDTENLKATVERYNQFAEAGEDLDFNKRGELTAFTDGPYYIMISKPAVHHTMGGIKINTNAQVVNETGEIIPGLYAAGEVTGDIHGTNRLGSNAIADIVVFGRIAGENAAKETLAE